jgi:cytochrome oxidase assembly protein ShyY1
LLQRLDFDAAEQALGVRLEPWQVRINPDHPLALTTEWKVSVTGPEKHLGYATQWFSMAFALFCMWIYAGLRRGSGDNNEKR